MAKNVGSALKTGAACEPFREHLRSVREAEAPPASWAVVESQFLRAMEAFDTSVIAGLAKEGERQNGKGDYFNDLLAVILENAAGVSLNSRRNVPGLIFPNHNLDITYPVDDDPTTIAEVMVEAKMMGTPQHPGNEGTQRAEGRPASGDILKRCKEAGFKSIDLKSAYGMVQGAVGVEQQEGFGGDLTSWLRTVRPKSYMALAVRVTGEADVKAVIAAADNMTRVMDGVALFIYRPVDFSSQNLSPPRYEAVKVPATLEMVRVLQRVSNDLVRAKNRAAQKMPMPPSLAVEEAVEDVEDSEA